MLRRSRSSWLLVLGLLLATLAVGCADAREARERNAAPARRYAERELHAPQRYGGAHAGGVATGDSRDGAAFARWVLEQDPQRRYLTDAVVRGEQVLGVKVQPTVTKRELRELLPALAEGMARTFPGRPLVVNAFDQSGDKVAEALYDPRTGRIDVQTA